MVPREYNDQSFCAFRTYDMKKFMNFFGLVAVFGSVVTPPAHLQDTAGQNPHTSDPAPPDGDTQEAVAGTPSPATLDGDSQEAVAGTPSPSATEEEVDVEWGDGRRMSQHGASTTSSAASVNDDEGGATSRQKKVKQNLLIGFALLSPSCTGLFAAHSIPFALYMGLTSLGLVVSVFLSYAGNDIQENFQKALLAVSTMALLGALSMLGVGASVQTGFF